MTIRERWRRVNRGSPCPVCGKRDWCAVSADGAAVLCQRVQSDRRRGDAGWLHRIKDIPWRRALREVRSVALSSPNALRSDLAQLATRWQKDVDAGELNRLALALGVSVASLSALEIGWSAEHQAWVFPMLNVHRKVEGIRLRRPNGYKFAVRGSKEGLFFPHRDTRPELFVLICEGPTDAAALLDMGYPNVVGRPSCLGGVKVLIELLREWDWPDVVVLADGDDPGRRGADNLASVLRAYVPTVRVILPPAGVKDARDWLRSGGSRDAVEEAIDAATPLSLAIRTRRV
jgi:hypothetical protein